MFVFDNFTILVSVNAFTRLTQRSRLHKFGIVVLSVSVVALLLRLQQDCRCFSSYVNDFVPNENTPLVVYFRKIVYVV